MLETTPLRIWQISDTHCYADDTSRLIWSPLPVYPNQALSRVLSHLRQQEPCQALVISGDLAQEEIAATYQRINTLLADFPAPVHVLPGNHDQPALMHAELTNALIQVLKPVVCQNWHCLLLDSSRPLHGEGYLTSDKLAELKQALQQLASDHYALIFLHHHPLSIASPWMDKMGLQRPEQFWEIVNAFPQVKAVAFGHIHDEFRGQVTNQQGNPIAVYGTPATCVQLTHHNERLGFKHANPGWREFLLFPDGRVETSVQYLQDSTPKT